MAVDPHPIRLVALDLDGTLLDDSKRVTDVSVSALRAAAARGVKVVIASARPPRSVRHLYTALGLDTLQINYNGALVWDEPARRPVDHRPMDPAVVLDLVAVVRARWPHVLVGCEILDRWCTDRLDPAYSTETARLFAPDVVAPVAEFCVEPITKLLLLGDAATMARVGQALAEITHPVTVIHGEPELIQVMDASASKGVALRRVAEQYDVPLGEVLAVGDAVNDVPMLEAAGVAVAVANAQPAAKAVADWVAPSNNDDGVVAALRHYGLIE